MLHPALALVPGEPAGVGPELCVRLVQQPRQDCRLVAFADPATLQAAAAALDLPLRLLPPEALLSVLVICLYRPIATFIRRVLVTQTLPMLLR